MNKIKAAPSSTIKQLLYDPSSKVLQVDFHSGTSYKYHGVPSELVQDFGRAKSAGKFLHKHIIDKFPVKKIDKAADLAPRSGAGPARPNLNLAGST